MYRVMHLNIGIHNYLYNIKQEELGAVKIKIESKVAIAI